MKILLLGANGQVGREIPEVAKRHYGDFEIVALDRGQLDITNDYDVIESINHVQPSLVINAAAYTAVDKAEQEPEIAFSINRDGPDYIAGVCAKDNIPLIHISTDYVFNGEKKGAYLETDTVDPINVYGKSKLEGELRIQEALEKHIILRTSWVFGVYGNNFVYSMINLAKQRQELRIVGDQTGCPTSAFSISNAILKICESISNGDKISWGIYNYCGSPSTNWCDFSKAIIEATKNDQEYCLNNIACISTAEYPTAAVRPQNSVLDCDKIRQQFGVEQQPWIEGLQQMTEHRHFSETVI